MIDTVKFKFSVSQKVMDLALSKASYKLTKDDEVKYWQLGIKIPSSDRNINVLGYRNSKNLFVEFSPIKQLLGTNIGYVTNAEIEKLVEEVRDTLNEELVDIPYTNTWIVQTLDDAYMWDYGDYHLAKGILDTMKNYAEKIFDTTCYKGCSKFYLKYPEYLSSRGDYNKLRYADGFLAEHLKDVSKGYLRFEYRLNGKSVYKNLGYYGWKDIIRLPESKFRQIAECKLLNYFNGSLLAYMSKEEAYKILKDKYGVSKAFRLISYMSIRDGDLKNKADILADIPKQTRYRNNADIKSCGIGVDASTQVQFPSLKNKYYLVSIPPLANPAPADRRVRLAF